MQLDNGKNIRLHRPASSVETTEDRFAPACQPRIEEKPSLAQTSDPRCVLRQGNYNICLADSPVRCSLVSKLIKCMYSWRGYHTENAVISSHNPNQFTLEASIERHPVGTLTLGLDSEEGLLADELYRREINVFRSKQRNVCELSKLAVDPQHSSKEILASLFHLAYIYGRNLHGATDLFIEVNPRHARFYKQMLGLRQIGEKRMCHRVNAPAILMHLDLDYADDQIALVVDSCEPRERSLYAYFLSKHEEERVTHTLRQRIHGRNATQPFSRQILHA
ncbi:hypothetical protein SAMN05216332_102162 [Nitrosospira briensis]|nr:hypothetical protein SAMN05216332_102162 [Nitrosospira briensis]